MILFIFLFRGRPNIFIKSWYKDAQILKIVPQEMKDGYTEDSKIQTSGLARLN